MAQNCMITTKGHYVTPSGGSKRCWNTFFYQSVAPQTTPSSVQQLLTKFLAEVWTPAIVPALTDSYLPDEINGRLIDLPTNPVVVGAVAQGTGTIVTDPLSGDSAIFLRFLTAKRGRNYNGSKHFAMGAESSTTKSELNAGGLVLWQAVRDALAATLTADAAGNIWYPVVFSPSLSDLTLATPRIIATPVTSVVLCSTIGTMRKRKEKGVYA